MGYWTLSIRVGTDPYTDSNAKCNTHSHANGESDSTREPKAQPERHSYRYSYSKPDSDSYVRNRSNDCDYRESGGQSRRYDGHGSGHSGGNDSRFSACWNERNNQRWAAKRRRKSIGSERYCNPLVEHHFCHRFERLGWGSGLIRSVNSDANANSRSNGYSIANAYTDANLFKMGSCAQCRGGFRASCRAMDPRPSCNQ